MFYLDILTKEKVAVTDLSDDAQFKIKEYNKLAVVQKAQKAQKAPKANILAAIETTTKKMDMFNREICAEIVSFINKRDELKPPTPPIEPPTPPVEPPTPPVETEPVQKIEPTTEPTPVVEEEKSFFKKWISF